MSMIAILGLLASFAAGVALGLVVFGGLWLTVRDLDRAPHPVLRMLGSLLLRLGLVLGAFYVVIGYGGWRHALAAVLGFTMLRVLVVRSLRTQADEKEADA